jgi:hypothetical protein
LQRCRDVQYHREGSSSGEQLPKPTGSSQICEETNGNKAWLWETESALFRRSGGFGLVKGKPWSTEEEEKLISWFKSGTTNLRVLAFSFEGQYSEEAIRQKRLTWAC